MTFDQRLEALSDDFGSTFTSSGLGILINMFDEAERPFVEALIKKHMGATVVRCERTYQFDGSYDMWVINYS